MKKLLLTGNEAIALGALNAGCVFYAGYPITPSSEIMHYMAKEMPRRGGVFIQAEDELAAINMIIGAALAGSKSMTATSGPGFSLMQEGIGYAVMVEAPIVVVDVMRAGPATGQATKPAQGDIMQARWGRHGDQYIVVLAPSNQQEAYDLTIKAFEIAWKLRVPVIVLTDEFIAHGREVIEIKEELNTDEKCQYSDKPPFGSLDPRKVPPLPPLGRGYNLLVTGSTHDEWGYRDVHSYETHFKLVRRLKDKIWLNINELFMYETYGENNAEIVFVTFGSVARSVKSAVKELNSKGISSLLIRLNTLWPLDIKVLRKYLVNAEVIIVPELNLGQLVYDVERVVVDEDIRIISFNKVGGGIPIYPRELVSLVEEMRNNA